MWRTSNNINSIGKVALSGVLWSLAANWGSRLGTFLLFVILARFLTPEQYGLVAAANIVLLFIGLVAEFGYGDAIVQRQNLKREEINLPFYVAIGISLLGSMVTFVFADLVEVWMSVPGLASVLVWVAAIAPFSTVALFQESIYRRDLAFRDLAIRAFVANLVAGPVAIVVAYLGAGVWSLVVFNHIIVLSGMIWLWWAPRWAPTKKLDFGALLELSRFGFPLVVMRILEFIAARFVDLLIVERFGVAALGVYAVGSRLYQVLIQLLQSALNNVSLPVLSSISGDSRRMGDIYIRAISFSGLMGVPVFVFCAVVSSELCLILFGAKWVGVDHLSAPLLLLGAVQCVQYLNGPYLTARGRPKVVLYISGAKHLVTMAGILSISFASPVDLVIAFCLLQLVATPMTFAAVSLDLGILPWRLLRLLGIIVLSNVVGFFTVSYARLPVKDYFFSNLYLQGLVLEVCVVCSLLLAFLVSFYCVLLIVGRSELRMISIFVKSNLLSRRSTVVS